MGDLSRLTHRLVIVIVLGLMSGIIVGCDDGGQQSQIKRPPPKVTIANPVVREIIEWDEYTGRFRAIDYVEVRARVSGYLEKIHFKDGQLIQKGDLLFTIDQRPFELAREQAQADLQQANTRLVLAEKELKRAGQLLRKGHVSQSVFDQRLQTRNETRSAIDAAKAALNRAKLDLEYSKIKSPVSGRISRYLVSVGNLIGGGSVGATHLTTIVSLDPIHFYFDAPEDAYLKYVRLDRSGQRPGSRSTANPVYLSLSDEKGYPHKGEMNFVDNRFDAGTGTIQGRAIFSNPSLIFQPNMFARIRLLGSGKFKATMVPEEVIGTGSISEVCLYRQQRRHGKITACYAG
ncbi:MAG: efflux RND transporter periplasmic adaptor subunit [Rhodospirillaceae bacterium]|jgi:multidrug efflux system membrane fusion protein